jgi:hypothetical protein
MRQKNGHGALYVVRVSVWRDLHVNPRGRREGDQSVVDVMVA